MPTPSYEIPSAMRDMAEKSVEQASRAFDGFMTAARKAAGLPDGTPAVVPSRNDPAVGAEALGFAGTDVRSAFDLARKLVRARDLQEVLTLQADYARTQLTHASEQAGTVGRSGPGRSDPRAGSGAVGTEAGSAPRADAEAPDVDEAAFQPSARALAVLRGVEIARRDLAEAGGTYTAAEVRRLLDLRSEEELDDMVSDGVLLTLTTPRRELRFPVFQFDEDGSLIDGVETVRKALPTRNLWAVLNFMTRPHGSLGARRPIDLLRSGQVDLVLDAARSVGVQGA